MELFDALTSPKQRSLQTWVGGELVATPWDEVIAGAHRAAAGLRRRGVEGGPVACVLTNTAEVVRGMLGIWLAGSPVASLPVPARAMGIEGYADDLASICADLESPLLLVESRLAEALRAPLAGRVELVEWEELPAGGRCEPAPPAPDQPAFIQYSSGSTSAPKGCVLSGTAIATQLEMIGEMCEYVPRADVGVSWLPLSHDMGTFGCLLSTWVHDVDFLLSSPERFIRDPRTWFEDCARFGATISAGSPSALYVAARAQRTRPLPERLRLRSCVLGGERIASSALAAANEAYAPFGLVPSVWLPAYGMAEATLMVTGIECAAEPSVRFVDSAALAEERIEHRDRGGDGATEVVCLGHPRGGAELRLESAERLSEIHLRSPCLASGYFRDPVRTAERFRDGELASGDLGFLHGGELYVVGRSDDVLSVAGRNVYAREIEAAVDLFETVRSGCSTVIDAGVESRSRLVMLLELVDEAVDYRDLAVAASRTARRKAGVLLDECVFLPKGALPKTPSGKIQRFRCRHMLAERELEPLERIALRGAGR